MELNDLKEDTGLTLEDLKAQETSAVNITSQSASQVAGVEVATGSITSKEQFQALKQGLLSGEARERFILEQEQKRLDILSDAKQETANVLVDPSLGDDEKQSYLDALQAPDSQYKYKPLDFLAEQAVVSDGAPDETPQTAASRINWADEIGRSNQLKIDQQAIVNALALQRKQSTAASALDLAEYFVPYAEWIDVWKTLGDAEKELGLDAQGNQFLMGNKRKALFELPKQIPVEDRAKLTQQIIDLIDENDQMIFSDGNNLAAIQNLQGMLVDNDYGDFMRWFDNVTGVLEVVGIFKLPSMIKKFAKGAGVLDEVSKAEKTAVKTAVAPSSPKQVIVSANPEQVRKFHKLEIEDEAGEASEAISGATREESLADDILPQPEMIPGTVKNKVKMNVPEYAEPEEFRVARTREGWAFASPAEVAKTREKLTASLEDIEGMDIHKGSTTIAVDEEGITTATAFYRPKDSGFKTADEALENAKFAFKHYGLRDEDITLFYKKGDEWIETTQKELSARKALREGYTKAKKAIDPELKDFEYSVGIKHEYQLRSEDLILDEVLDSGRFFGVPLNYLDRFPSVFAKWGQGSLVQNFLDAASVIHPQISVAAGQKFDKSIALRKLYVDHFVGFTKVYKKLSKGRRLKMTNYINEANFKGLRFDEAALRADGFNDTEVQALRDWRKGNDAMFHATNADLVKTLRNKGFKVLKHEGSDTRLVVKPIKRGGVNSNTQYYDVATGKMVDGFDSVEDLDNFYEGGGTLTKLQEPMKVGDEWIDVIRSDEKSGSSYTRAMRDDEQVLAYRDGYYPVMYDANFFIDKIITLKGGKEIKKTVASARNKKELEQALKGFRDEELDETVESVVYRPRPDRRSDLEKEESLDEGSFALNVSGGTSSQRMRGERLKDAAGDLHLAGMSNLEDPLQAVNTSISQLSQRLAVRNYMDTTKRRWIETYAEKLGLKKNKYDEYEWPGDITQVKGSPEVDRQLVADARTMYNYVYSLENSYINGIDEAIKLGVNGIAEIFADLGVTRLEEIFRGVAKSAPTSTAKSAVFKLYLAANPLRQLVIQAHQNVQLAAINPKYMAGPIAMDLYRIGRAMRGATDDADAVKMLEELTTSGMMDAVDANNLIRSDLLRLADTTALQKVGTITGKPLNIAQKVGFDKAEQSVLVMSWLAHRDMAIKAGTKLDRRAYDEIAGQARAYTYSMNRAGDMPYNSNSLNVIAQFLQVPHKALLQPLTNRTLNKKQRATLLAWNTVNFGVPTGLMTFIYENMKPGVERDILEYGLEDVVLNSVLSAVSGEEQQIDWGDLAPGEWSGMQDFVVALATTAPGDALAKSPAGSLWFGGNPRLTEMFRTTARFFHLNDYEDPLLETNFVDVSLAFANLFSGASNVFKAKYAYETGKKISSMGNITDPEVTRWEARVTALGFRTKTEEGTRVIMEEIYGDEKFTSNDVDIYWNNLKRHITRRGQSLQEAEIGAAALREGLRVFDSNMPKFQQMIISKFQSDATRQDYTVVKKLIEYMGVNSKSDTKNLINKLPDSPHKRELNKMVDNLNENWNER